MILTVILVICLVAIALMIKPTLHYALDQHVEIGQNYSTVVPSASHDASQKAE